ncbi:unnamed protein product [Boreogadus saida]
MDMEAPHAAKHLQEPRRAIQTRLTTCSTADFDALYEELQQLGEGGFGSVFAGCRKEDRLPVAIKHIPMAKVSMTQETVEGRLTDFPLEVSLMLRAAEDRPDPGGPGAVVHSRNKSKKVTFKQKNKAEFGF